MPHLLPSTNTSSPASEQKNEKECHNSKREEVVTGSTSKLKSEISPRKILSSNEESGICSRLERRKEEVEMELKDMTCSISNSNNAIVGGLLSLANSASNQKLDGFSAKSVGEMKILEKKNDGKTEENWKNCKDSIQSTNSSAGERDNSVTCSESVPKLDLSSTLEANVAVSRKGITKVVSASRESQDNARSELTKSSDERSLNLSHENSKEYSNDKDHLQYQSAKYSNHSVQPHDRRFIGYQHFPSHHSSVMNAPPYHHPSYYTNHQHQYQPAHSPNISYHPSLKHHHQYQPTSHYSVTPHSNPGLTQPHNSHSNARSYYPANYNRSPHHHSPYMHSHPQAPYAGPSYPPTLDSHNSHSSHYEIDKQYQMHQNTVDQSSLSRPSHNNSTIASQQLQTLSSSSTKTKSPSCEERGDQNHSQLMSSNGSAAVEASEVRPTNSVEKSPPPSQERQDCKESTKFNPKSTFSSPSFINNIKNASEHKLDPDHVNKKAKLEPPVVSNPNTPVSIKVPNHAQYTHNTQYFNKNNSDGSGEFFAVSSKRQSFPGKHNPQPYSGTSPDHYISQGQIPLYANTPGPQTPSAYPQHSPVGPTPQGMSHHYFHPGSGPRSSEHVVGKKNSNYEYFRYTNNSFSNWHSYPTPNQNQRMSTPVDVGNPTNPMLVTPKHHTHLHHPNQYQNPNPPTPSDGIHDFHKNVHDYSKSPIPPTSNGEITSVAQWQQAQRLTGFAPSANKCVPLKSPIPSKFWGDVEKTKDAFVPDFHRLVNFPDYLPKNSPPPGAGMRCCVMCGKPRLCTASISKSSVGNESNGSNETKNKSNKLENGKKMEIPINSGTKASKSFQRSSNIKGNDGTPVHIIPRQNKGLCTACDVTVWVVTQSHLEIKWCKGCKNFRPWAAFGDKGLATKCVRCRDRQREKYALQKRDLKQKRRLTVSPLKQQQKMVPSPSSKSSSPLKENESSNEEKKMDSSKEEKENANRKIAASGLSNLIAATNKIDP